MTTVLAQPAAEIATSWLIDPAHSNVEFAVRHLMISSVKGRFGDISGAVKIDPANLSTALVDVRQPRDAGDVRMRRRTARAVAPAAGHDDDTSRRQSGSPLLERSDEAIARSAARIRGM